MSKKHRQRGHGHLQRTGNSTQSVKGAVCPYCGKRSYMSRKFAREANRRLYPNEKMSTYRCPQAPDFVDTSQLWHIGHLAEAVVKGKAPRSQVHGSEELQMARPVARKPIHPALRAIVTDRGDKTPNDNDADDEEGDMPTVSEVANVNLKGFDRGKGRYREVTAGSPIDDRLALVHAALRAQAVSKGFDEMKRGRTQGFVGRTNLRALIRELFVEEVGDDRLPSLAKTIQSSAERRGLMYCVDSSGRLHGQDPIWWVAADFAEVAGHAPFEGPRRAARKTAAKSVTVYGDGDGDGKAPAKRRRTAPRGKKRDRRPPKQALDRMYRVRAVLDDVGGRYDTALTYNEILEELRARGDEPSYGQVVTAVDLLVAEGQADTRQMTAADKEAIRAAGGTAPSGVPPVLAMLRKHMDGREIPVLLGTLDQLRETEQAAVEPDAFGAAGQTYVAAQEAAGQPVEAPEEQAEPQAAEGPERPSTEDWDQAVLEEVLRDTMALSDLDARHALVAARMRITELAARVAKLEKARDGLLAALDTLKD